MQKNKLQLIIIFFLINSCSQKITKVTTSEQNTLENVKWITDARPLPASDSLFYLDMPAPIFRKVFTPKNKLKKANLLITAAGYYKATINGEPVGNSELDPAWTTYDKRIYYSEYDVTSLIVPGNNCLAVTLGNGFYNPLPLRKWGRRNLREDLKVGKPAFLAKLQIIYPDGKTETIVSDNTWKYSYSPVIKNDVYLGITYDARKELKGWNTSNYNDNQWNTAVKGEGPGGQLQKAFFPSVQITKEIDPVEIYSPGEGIYIVDMGVNFTGTYKIKLYGFPGDSVVFRFGERIYKDGTVNTMTAVAGQIKRKGVGGPGAPDIAWQTDTYIFGDRNGEWFTPDFTYHTYRYMEIIGLKYKPLTTDIKGLFIHTNIENKNSFVCSSSLLNNIQDATKRTFQANVVSVQSDCAAREKFGYGGDLNATNESFIYNYDMQSFYRKTIYDWVDAMKDSSFIDTAPFVGVEYCGISWESAFIITQYYLYLYYHDTSLVKELYSLDTKWMDKAARIHPNLIVEEGLADHESLVPVPVQLTGTAHYLQCAQIMQKFASVMHDTENEKKYSHLAEKLKAVLLNEFWRKPVKKPINKQTLYATLLYHEIIPPAEIEAAKDSLLKSVEDGPSGHFNTGIYGTKYILEVLSKHIGVDHVFRIVNSTAYPGWGYMIDHGATTIWETWKESDNTYSNCHPMFGSVTEWFYRWLAGIRPDPEYPGFKKFILNPSTPDGLEFATSSYASPYGNIVSTWKKLQAGTTVYEMVIPSGSIAKVILPLHASQKYTLQLLDKRTTKTKSLNSNHFELGEGDYLITVTSNE